MKYKIEHLDYYGPEWCYCRGILNVDIDGKHYTFDKPFWESGGSVSWSDGADHVTQGDWLLNPNYIPKNITREIAEEIIEAMNEYLPKGCCGGCL